MKLLEVVQGHRRAFNSYHDHKEKSAYAVTTLYIAATSWWVASERFWALARPLTIVISAVVAIIAAAMVGLFLFWQLRNRLDAAVVEAACINVESKIVAGEIDPDARIDHAAWQRYRLPKPITDEIPAARAGQARDLALPVGVMYLAIGIWTALVLIRIGAAARTICP